MTAELPFVFLAILCLTVVTVATRKAKKRRSSAASWWRKYNAYLRSPEWKMKRQAVINRCGGRCERCAKTAPIEVHHLPGSYARIPNELPWDLAALCYDCHKGEHPGKRF